MAAPSDAGQFGQQLASTLQLVEQLPNPLFLIYDYVLNIAGGTNLQPTPPKSLYLFDMPTTC